VSYQQKEISVEPISRERLQVDTRALTSMLAGIAYVTILGSVSVSTIPTVGMLEMLHSLINARFSDGLRMTTMSGR
jgi:hypothetical protein